MQGVLPLLFNFFIQMIYMGLYPQRHVLGRAITHKASFHESFAVAGLAMIVRAALSLLPLDSIKLSCMDCPVGVDVSWFGFERFPIG